MPSNRTKGGFYAVKKGRNVGIYTTWAGCEAQVKGFPDAKYQKFLSLPAAEQFLTGAAPSRTDEVGPSGVKGSKGAFGTEIQDVSGWDIVYSDGACKGNGKVGSVAGIGVWWGSNDPRNLAERCPGDQTNNRAELIAILRVLETTPVSKKSLMIRTDSQYSMNCLRTWIHKWKDNDWRSAGGDPVKNAGIIRCISMYLDTRSKLGQKVVLEYVKGHSGDLGNDGADAMANQGALLLPTPERDWEALERQLARQFDEIMPVGAAHGKIEIVGLKGGEADVNSIRKQSPPTDTNPKPLTEQSVEVKSIFERGKSPTRSSSARLYEDPSSSPKKFHPAPLHHPADIKSPQKMSPFIFQSTSPNPPSEQPVKLKSIFEGEKNPIRSSSARLYEEPFSPPKKPHPTTLHHRLDIKPLQIPPSVTGTISPKPLAEQPKLNSIFEAGKSPPTPTRSSSAHPYENASSSPKKPHPTTPHHSSGTNSPLKVTYVSPLLVPVRAPDVNFEDYADCLLDDSDLANDISD